MKRRALVRAGGAALALAGALVILRLFLPAIALRAVNRKLGHLEGYQGRVDGIGISLWRGAYQIKGLDIEKKGGKVPVPFFSADAVDFSLEWRALLRRRIVTRIEMWSPVINFVKGPTEETSATNPNESFAQTLTALAPFDIDSLQVLNGEIHYRDFSSSPKVDISLTDVRGEAINLRNTRQAGVALPADVRIAAKAFGTGDLSLEVKADPLQEKPTFELKQKLTGVEFVRLNDFLEAYAKVRAKKGVFELYVEAAAKDGKFLGYAQPLFKDLEIDKGSKVKGARKVWAFVASAVEWIFSNKKKNLVATKIPIQGDFGDAKVGIWPSIEGILKNAYIRALTPKFSGLKLEDVKKAKGG
jgi:hypothetical protein